MGDDHPPQADEGTPPSSAPVPESAPAPVPAPVPAPAPVAVPFISPPIGVIPKKSFTQLSEEWTLSHPAETGQIGTPGYPTPALSAAISGVSLSEAAAAITAARGDGGMEETAAAAAGGEGGGEKKKRSRRSRRRPASLRKATKVLTPPEYPEEPPSTLHTAMAVCWNGKERRKTTKNMESKWTTMFSSD